MVKDSFGFASDFELPVARAAPKNEMISCLLDSAFVFALFFVGAILQTDKDVLVPRVASRRSREFSLAPIEFGD